VCSNLRKTQGEVKGDLETLLARLQSLVCKHREGIVARFAQLINICYDYKMAKGNADYHRILAQMHDSRIIDLDAATDHEMSHIGMMLDAESVARDECTKAIAIIRSELKALEEIKEMCSQVLELMDETSEDKIRKVKEQKTSAEGDQKIFISKLEYLH
jgi:predicted RND superfamily exporter protein